MLEVRYRGQCLNIDSFKEVWARQWVPSTLRVVGGGRLFHLQYC